jgi:peptide/nickel transport system permease protein
MSQEQKAEVRAAYALDSPIHQQYLHYLGRLVRLDLGYSYRSNRPVLTMVMERLPWTLALTFTSLVISALTGSALGVYSAWRRSGTSDVSLLVSLLVMRSLPAFWLAMVLIAIFSVELGWLPVFGGKTPGVRLTGLAYYADLLKHWLLPAVTLMLVSIPGWFMTMRYAMLDTLSADYIRTARAKGVSEYALMFRHAMRNALLPVTTNFMLSLAYSVSGATLIETVFSYPGMGRMLFEAVLRRDYPVIRSTFLIITLIVVAANFVADLLYPLLDPRVGRVA